MTKIDKTLLDKCIDKWGRQAQLLMVLEEICPLSARVVVNQVSMKMENERITGLLNELKKVL